jgi:hypothetical protein
MNTRATTCRRVLTEARARELILQRLVFICDNKGITDLMGTGDMYNYTPEEEARAEKVRAEVLAQLKELAK